MMVQRDNGVISLWELTEKSAATICELSDNIPERYQRRLRELGFHANEHVSCVKWTFAGGPRLYQIGNCVYSLDREIAQAIDVKKQEAI